ncbi:MAG: haloacid dehalogenase-like hydrolase [Myxococcaceae bacterium]|nr:MAG: haloacid dehalogenase-like hydrolase [Myxococcaceae bacterium]
MACKPASTLLLSVLLSFALVPGVADGAEPLPSWNEGEAKQSILQFVESVTREGAPTFVAAAERIAVFDNDGTLWAEQPAYFQLLFAVDRVKALAPKHPEWKTQPPFSDLLKGNLKGVAASGEPGLAKILAATHAGITTDEFAASVAEWTRTARHPRFQRPYTDLTYLPMRELLGHLRANGFKTFIVSGGGADFVRVFAERIYGIPPEQVIGSYGGLELRKGADGKLVLMKLAKVELVDDHAGKPVGIQRFIGRRPIFAFGNSDGDQQMLEWTAAGDGPRFMGLVHHTDAEREYAYDRKSHVGQLDKAWDEATARKWTVVDMKKDWKQVFSAP